MMIGYGLDTERIEMEIVSAMKETSAKKCHLRSLVNHSRCFCSLGCTKSLPGVFGFDFRLGGGVGMHEFGRTPVVKHFGNFLDNTFIPE